MARRAAFHNLGCKVNMYEVEAMKQSLEAAGYDIVPFEPGADVYIINTCTVTNIADKKSRQMLHRAKKMNPDAVVVAVGCYVQTRGADLQKDGSVDIVLGTDEKGRLLEMLENRTAGSGSDTARDVPDTHDTYEPLEIAGSGDHTRAFLKVQDGCDRFCTYCIIPYARGRVRSRRPDDVMSEARRLADSGTGEIVLTGIHICSYGKDLERDASLTDLIRKVHDVPGIRRLRLSSLEPSFITEDAVAQLRELPKLCPHFHLSLQSGCDDTLRRMGRRYTTEDYAYRAAMLREAFERPALTTDIITGFPGETDEEFEKTLEFADRMDFFDIHIFPYSRRAGTKAADMPGQLPMRVRKEREHLLEKMQREHRQAYLESFVGKNVEILLENEMSYKGVTCMAGHGREYQKVLCRGSGAAAGSFVTVIPERADEGVLLA